MIIRILTHVILVTLLATVYALFTIKNNVSTLRYQLATISKQINNEKDAIHLFKAEFATLTAPKRLKKLASIYLNLETIKTTQLVKDPLSDDLLVPTKDYAKAKVNSNIHWRYKRPNNKFITTIANKK